MTRLTHVDWEIINTALALLEVYDDDRTETMQRRIEETRAKVHQRRTPEKESGRY